MKTVPEMLRESADLYESRNKEYGDSYKIHGGVMAALFPEGVNLKSVSDHNRFGVLTMMISKISRYAHQFDKDGHDDSLMDLVTYTAMIRELDQAEFSKAEEGALHSPPTPPEMPSLVSNLEPSRMTVPKFPPRASGGVMDHPELKKKFPEDYMPDWNKK